MSFKDRAIENGLIAEGMKGVVLKDQQDYSLDLGTARTNVKLANFSACDYLVVTDLDGSVSMRINDITAPLLDLSKIRRIMKSKELPIERLFFTNTAQAGKTLAFLTGGDTGFQFEMAPASEGELQKKLNKATTPLIYNVTCTVANTEYSQVLPASTKKFSVNMRDSAHVGRMAYVTGKVAAPTEPYLTIWAGSYRYEDLIEPTALTLFLASPTAGAVAEIAVWS